MGRPKRQSSKSSCLRTHLEGSFDECSEERRPRSDTLESAQGVLGIYLVRHSASKPIQFPYVRFPTLDPFTKRWSAAYRPVIPVTLRINNVCIRTQALLDSGADECIFSGEIASALGLRLTRGRPRIFGGIGGSAVGYLHKTVIEFENVGIRCPIYYSDEWNHLEFGLLGHAGFFSRFKVILDHRAKLITLLPQTREVLVLKPLASAYFQKTAGVLGTGGKVTRALLRDRTRERQGGK